MTRFWKDIESDVYAYTLMCIQTWPNRHMHALTWHTHACAQPHIHTDTCISNAYARKHDHTHTLQAHNNTHMHIHCDMHT